MPGIEAFLGIAHRLSFRQAAAEMNLSQAALSHRIEKFEEAFGTELLVRTTRRVALTEAGLELLPVAERVVADMERALAGLRDRGRSGPERLAIGCLPTVALLYLPAALAAFRQLHPAVRVQVYDNSAAEIESRVRKGEASFGITVVSPQNLDPSLEITPLARDPFVLVCPAGHPLAARNSVQWRDLEKEALIRISAEAANRVLIDSALGRRREALHWRIEVQRVPTAIGKVRAGLGVTILPQSGLDAQPLAGLLGVKIRNPTISSGLGIISLRDRPMPPLSTLLAQQIADLLPR